MNAANDPDASPLKFPTAFPIKVMGRHEPDFQAQVVALIEAHVGMIAAARISTRASGNDRFLAVTVTIEAQSREQLDAIYHSLSASDRVLMVL